MKYLIRLLALPFMFGLHAIWLFYILLKRCVLFVRFGGEYIPYKEGDKKTIQNIYELLKKDKV